MVAGALLLLLGGAPAWAQLAVSPESLRVALPQGQEATRTLVLANPGGADVTYCVDFLRLLPTSAPPRLGGSTCRPPGEVLAAIDRDDIGTGWGPYGVVTTPEGRVFVAEGAGLARTFEFTPALTLVRDFASPVVVELTPFAQTAGLSYDDAHETLWWTNVEATSFTVERVLLLEGDLDGVPTGRRIELPVPEPGPPPYTTGAPAGATYDPTTGRYYYVDALLDNLWAADTAGVVLPGYPRTLAARPGAYLGNSADTHGGADPAEGGDPAGVRIEVLAGPVDTEYDAVVVTDAEGRDLGVETPLPVFPGNGYALGWSARSRWDPNGLMYASYFGRNEQGEPRDGVAAIRPAPLSPTWLALPAWNGQVPAGGSSELTLTFRAGSRAPGEYRTVLVLEDTAGVVLASVPLVLEVTPDTPAEPGPDRAGASLAVTPNPARGAATVTLALPAPASVRVAVHDVLGREVGVFHDGPLQAGAHVVAVPALPAGMYVVRASGPDGATVARFVVTR